VCPCGQNVPAWVPRDTNHRRNRVRPPGTAFSVCRHAHGAAAALISCRDTQGGVVWCGKQFQLVWWVTANRVLQKQARPPTDCDYPTNPERPPQIAHRFPQNTGTSLACTHRIRSPALSARCPHLHRRYKFPGTLLAVVPNRYKPYCSSACATSSEAMAPSASMLFLSYHQLHGPAPRKEEASHPGGGGVRFSVGSVFSLAVPVDQGKTVGCRRDDAAVEEKSPAATELEEKFEEALRLSCWA
jgi:hypothetical protein